MLLWRAYESSSRNEALMAADSCWMSARSSATVCGWKVSDVGLTVWGRPGQTLEALMPLMRAATRLRQVLIDDA